MAGVRRAADEVGGHEGSEQRLLEPWLVRRCCLMLKSTGSLLSRKDGRSDCSLVQALCPWAQWGHSPPCPLRTDTQPLRVAGASQEVCSAGLHTWALAAGGRVCQGRIFPRTSGGTGWEKNARKATPWCRPRGSSIAPLVTVALPEGPILHPLQGN